MEVSIIIRFRNEATYLQAVMEALAKQEFPGGQYEIIAIDNCSTDNSREIATRYIPNVLSIEDYQPGKALNQAISHAKGKCIAVLSAHALPSNRLWLQNLYRHMSNTELAGVYGAQLYEVHSRFLDKRDLDIFSTLEPRVETSDSDFWNANSMFSRSLWEKQRFDETVFEMEDHYWTKQVLPMGYQIHFEPSALIYHYGHINRIDREHLPTSSLSEEDRIEGAIRALENDQNNWPIVMKAGLTLSSLTHSRHIRRAVQALGKTLQTHPDFDVRWRAAQALGKIPDTASVDYLVEALCDSSFYPRDEAAWSLARLGAISVSPLLDRLGEFPSDIIPFAALALGCSGMKVGEEQAVNLLLAEIRSGDAKRQRDAIYFAGEIAKASTSELLVKSIEELTEMGDEKLVSVCCWALGCYAQKAYEIIDWRRIQALSRSHPYLLTRFEATTALGKLGLTTPNPDVGEWLIYCLSDEESRIRYGAMQSIRRLVEERGIHIPDGLKHWQDDDFGVMFELHSARRLDLR